MKKISDWLHDRKNMLIYIGNPGCGKTFFSAAMINYCWQKFEFCRAWTDKIFFEKLRGAIDDGYDYTKCLNLMLDDEFMIFDDLGSTGVTEWRKEIVFDMVDGRYSSMKPTIITTNLTMGEIKTTYHERVLSRIFAKENTIIIVDGEDKRQTM